MISNRQGGRRRGRGGGRAPNPNAGNRQDNRQRGNAAQLLEKYKGLARDTQMQGDRVQSEYFLQFADHYYRVLNESRARYEEQRRQRDDDDDSDGDDDQDEQQHQQQHHAGRREAQYDRDPQQDRDQEEDEGHRPDRGRGNGAERPRRQRARRDEPEEQGEEERIALDSLPPAISSGSGEEKEERSAPRTRARRPRKGDEIAPAA